MRRAVTAAFVVFALLLAFLPTAASAFGPLPGAEGFAAGATEADESAATRAGEHPFAVHVDLALASSPSRLREAAFHLPAGLLANVTTINECTASSFAAARVSPFEASASGENCPAASQVGVAAVSAEGATRRFGVFLLEAPPGSVAAIGLAPFGTHLTAKVQLRETDSGLDLDLAEVPAGFGLEALDLTLWGTPWESGHDGERGNCLNETGGASWGSCYPLGSSPPAASLIKSFLTLPTTPCGVPLTWTATLRSWSGEEAGASAGSPALAACNKALTLVKVQLTSASAAARTGLAVNLEVNDGGGITNPAGIARPALKTALLSLPPGLTINPSLGAGLGVCTEAQFASERAGSEPGAGCPNSSKIGTVKLEGALGVEEPMVGSIYLATPRANPFGSLLAVYMLARNPRRGMFIRSEGRLEPNPSTGTLEASFEELPRLLYTHFSLSLREGQRSVLISPPLCGTYPANLRIASWAEPLVLREEKSIFLITSGDRGGPCPAGGAPPFAPKLLSGSLSPQAGAHTPFYLRFTREDSEAPFTSYSATLPPGLLGQIAGVPACPDAAIEAAKGRSGTAEAARPSCPAASQIGTTIAGYGVGGTLAWASGDLYLAGPYHGAPLSVVAIDPALVGPFDLGVVVVRQAVRVDPTSAQVSLDPTGSDPIPSILDGIPLHLADIRVSVDRPNFMVNPTSCNPMKVSSTLGGAGVPAAQISERYQVLNCQGLRFAPKLAFHLGASRHGAFPSLRATYTAPPGGANLGSVAVNLPSSLFLEQAHIRGVCTRVQFAAGAGNGAQCPASSVYGHAVATTPLLETPLEGPVYLRSSSQTVPDLVVPLQGRGIQVVLDGRIDTAHGGVRAHFEGLPDAAATKFVMTLDGGKRGLLVNSASACGKPKRAIVRFIGQDNATAIGKPAVTAKCPKAKAKKKKPGAKKKKKKPAPGRHAKGGDRR